MNEQYNHMDIDSLINSISETESWKKLKNNEVKLSVYQKFIEIKKLIKKIYIENNLKISDMLEFIQRVFDKTNIIEEIEIGSNYLELRYKNAEIIPESSSYEPVLKYKTVLLNNSQNYTRVTLYKLMFNLPIKPNEVSNKNSNVEKNKNRQNSNFNNQSNSNISNFPNNLNNSNMPNNSTYLNNFENDNSTNTSNNLNNSNYQNNQNNQNIQNNQYLNKNPILTDPANGKQIQLIYKLLREINQKENAYKYIKENFHINRSSELKNITIEQAEIITKQLEKIKKNEKFQSLKQQHGMNTNEIKELENISKQNNQNIQNNPNDQIDSNEPNIETLDKLDDLPNIEKFNQLRKNIGNKEAVKNQINETNKSIEQKTSSQSETIEVIDNEIIDLSSI